MSAIAGIINLKSDKPIMQETVVLMLEAMKPDMPYDIETYAMSDKSAVVGRIGYGPDSNNKLKKKSNNDYQILMVGEIYNDDVIKYDTSADYLLERYQQSGWDYFAPGLNGAFSAVIADPNNKAIVLITDHTDSCTIYTTRHEGKLYFASEVKGIMAVKEISREPDISALLSLLVNGFFILRRTLMKNVEQMDYATIYYIHDGEVRSFPYWRYTIEPTRDRGRSYYLNEFEGLLRQAVKRRAGNGRIALMLSGGIDSRGILSCLENPSKMPAVTYTCKTMETRHVLGDWSLAESIANKFGMDFITIYYNDNNFVEAMKESVFATDASGGFVFQNIWGDIRNNTGAEYLLMGDECMGWSRGPMTKDQVLSAIGICSLRTCYRLRDCMRQDSIDYLIDLQEKDMAAVDAGCQIDKPHDRVDYLYFNQRLIHYLLSKRRIIMRHGLFVRNPWLDLDILNFIQTLPLKYRRFKRLFLDTINRINPDLSNITRARTPETISYRNYISKMENHNKAFSRIILDNNPLLNDIFDIVKVQQLIQNICATQPSQKSLWLDQLLTYVPIVFRVQSHAYIKRLTKSKRKLSGENLLLNIATVGMALKHLSN